MIDITTLGVDFDISGLLRGRRALSDTTDAANRTADAADRTHNKFSALSSMSGMLATALSAIGVGLLVREFIQTADAVSLMDARLKLAMGNMEDFEQAQRDVYAIAQKNNVSLASTAALYTKLADPIRNAGGGVKEIRGIVDAFSTSLRISGASSEEASSSILQFGQAMAAGVLSGDEFKSLAESSPVFMKALAEGMGVPVGNLKKLGAEGKLTADIVGNSLLGSLTKLNAQAANLPDTFGGAMTRFKNDLTIAIRDLNSDTSVTGGLIGMVEVARSLIPEVRDALAGAFKAVSEWIGKNRDGLGEMWENAKLLLGDVWGLAKAAASVGAFISEWGTSSGTFNGAITLARYGVALLQDGVTYLAAGFAQFGSLIMQCITKPLKVAAEAAAWIVEVYDTDGAAKIRAAAKGMDDFASAGFKAGAEIAESFARGDSAVGRLDRSINGVKLTAGSTSDTLKKVSDAFDKLNKGTGGGVDAKTAAAANKELAKQSDLMAKLSGFNADYEEQYKRLNLMLKAGKITASEYADAQIKLYNQQPVAEKAAKAEADAKKVLTEFTKDYNSQLSITSNIMRDQLVEATEEAKKNEELAKNRGLSKSAIEFETVARLESQLAQRSSLGLTIDEIAHLERLIAVKKRNAEALVKTEGGPDLDAARATLEAMTALDSATQSAASSMADAFGAVGSAIGGMTTALTAYGSTQAAIEAERLAAIQSASGTREQIAKKIADAELKASKASAQASMKSYGDMAGAAKGFFKEQSTGYKVLETAEKSFRMMEMAMAIDNMIVKSGLISGYTGLFVAAKATETTVQAGATAASTTMAGTEASAWGITAVVKSLASLPFPFNIAAGAATLAAVVAIGANVMGSTGGAPDINPNSAEERQKVQGTGTVLGDSAAKSESMVHSLGIMEKYAALELDYQSSMLNALQNIETALGGAAKGIAQTTGITGGSAFNTEEYNDENTFSASHTKSIQDSGVKISGTFGQLRAGFGSGRQYEDIRTTSDGGMFHSGWTNDETKYKTLSKEAMKPFTLIFDNMGDLMVDAGTKLGYDSKSLNDQINQMSIDFGVSLRGLSGQDLTDALNAGVSVAFDNIAASIFPFLEDFQKMGEGLGETLVRVASDVQGVDSVFQSLGKWNSLTITAKETLVEASGGLDEFATQAKSFMQNFYTEAEQIAATKAKMNPVLSKYGLTTEGPDAQRMFRDFVLGLDVSTDAGAKTYAMLMDLQQSFFDVTDAAASQRKSLQDELDDLLLSPAQKLAKERSGLDVSNRALFDQIQLTKRLNDEREKSTGTLEDFIKGMKSFADSVRKTSESLLTGSLSVLTPEQQYDELRRQYEDTKAKAMAGDTKAQSEYASDLNAFLSASQKINGGDAAYMADFARAQADAHQLALMTENQIDTAQAQLDILREQRDGIDTLNESVRSLADELRYQNEMGGGTMSAAELASTAATERANTAAEMAALRETTQKVVTELAALRDDLKQQTGDTIKETAKVQESTTRAVVGAIEKVGGVTFRKNYAEDMIE